MIGVDYIEPLTTLAKTNLAKEGRDKDNRIEIHTTDGWLGWSAQAPYDAIHVGAAAASLPDALVEQLANGGRMVIPIGPDGG